MSDFSRNMSLTTPALVQSLAHSGAAHVRAAFEQAGLRGLRPVHASLLVPLLGGGRRASDLAETLGVSRQAVAQVVATLEREGYVERIADPGDARAKLICLTARGRQALRVMRQVAVAVEANWAEVLGPERLDDFRAVLLALLELKPGMLSGRPSIRSKDE